MNKLAFAALPVAALLTLVGCSGAPEAKTSSGPGAGASAPAKVKANLPAPGSEVDKAKFADKIIAGVQTFKTATVEMTSKSPDGKHDMTMTTVIDNSDASKPKSWTKSNMGGVAMEHIFDGTTIYMKRGSQGWTKMGLGDKAGGVRMVPNNQGDLAGMFGKYKASLKKVVYVGEEKVNGVGASHYTATDERTIQGKLNTSVMELYVDDQFRTVKSVMKAGPDEIVLNIGKFNEPVTITIPTDAKKG